MKSQKIRVAVLMGGPSEEYNVSLNTGKMVVQFLDKQKYTATPLVISKKGKWPITFKKLRADYDVAFIAMHGEYGEDGTIQTILDTHRIPYTGSGARASALGMNKVRSSQLFQKKNLFIPAFVLAQKSMIPKTVSRLKVYSRISCGFWKQAVAREARQGIYFKNRNLFLLYFCCSVHYHIGS